MLHIIDRLLLVLLVILLFSCQPTLINHFINSDKSVSSDQLVSLIGYSTVALVYQDVDNDDKTISSIKPYCTGVWLNNTQFITAYHCVQMMRRMQQLQLMTPSSDDNDIDQQINDLTNSDKVVGLIVNYLEWSDHRGVGRSPFVQHLARVIKVDPAHDLALLDSLGASGFHLFVRLALNKPTFLQEVEIVGHTHGFYWTFLRGSVSGDRGEIPHTAEGLAGPYLQIQAPIHTGNSGGGCFNGSGELMGIASFILNLPEGSIFIPAAVIKEFLQ